MENERANDNDRCVLAAHPGKSQGRPPKQPELEAHRPQTACPTTSSAKAPVPVNRPYGRARTATFKNAVSCPELRHSRAAPVSRLPSAQTGRLDEPHPQGTRARTHRTAQHPARTLATPRPAPRV